MSFPATPDRLSGMPLAGLPAVVLDTETTGLDTAHDRVIEIGAVRWAGAPGDGDQDGDETFATLVDPGAAIPPASTAIHGIRDEDVAGAPGFADAFAAYAAWSGPVAVLGYSVGFDLAVLKAEHDRAGLPWRAPRHLDVAHLVGILGPDLPEQSLEAVAAWLGLTVEGRHRALGDARLTARLFAAVVPRLRAKGIVTLAQAERACQRLTLRRDEEGRAGWIVDEAPGARAPEGMAEYVRIDSYPYRHRVADLMSSPPLTVGSGVPLRDALTTMTERQVSSLIVEPEASGGAPGIVTERDAMRAVQRDGAEALTRPVGALATRPLITIERDEFVYRALTRMAGNKIRHLGVTDAGGALVGALSARDLLRHRADDAVSLGDGIEAAETPAALSRVWGDLTAVARALTYEAVDARTIAAVISRELQALTRRAAELAARALAEAGQGDAPAPFALMVLGSGGRGESLLAMDQDNAIVFADDADAGARDWLAAFGTRVADILAEAGVSYCQGGVMASNEAWRMSAADWRETVGGWMARSRPEDMMNCDIFFDAVDVYGDGTLADALLADARSVARQSRAFLSLLSLKASQFERPVGLFGRLRLSNGRIDLKRSGIMPIFSAARVVALKTDIAARSTPERLAEAKTRVPVSEATVDNLVEAHRILLDLILRQQLRDVDCGLRLTNEVAPGELSGFEKQQLRWALRQVPGVAELLGTPIVG